MTRTIRSHRPTRAALPLAALAGGLALAAASPAAGAAPQAVQTRHYDLGVRQFPQPLSGRFANMPIRLWGTIGVPAGAGPFPVVVIAHGAHGDNCPAGELDGETWPCFAGELRSDLGFGYLVAALARQGVIAVAPDVNAAYTGGWGEAGGLEGRRYGQVLDATLAEIGIAGRGGVSRLPRSLRGRVDLSRVAVVGHSRGGYNAVRWSRTHPTVRSLFLLAPFFARQAVPDVPLTVALGTCDGDTGTTGAGYARVAAGTAGRRSRAVTLTATGPNHNFYNATLVRLGNDDASADEPACAATARPTARAQQRWLVRAVGDHVAATLLRPRVVAPYLQPSGPVAMTLAGLSTTVVRVPGP